MEEGENAITLGGVLHTRPLANLPTPKGACLGKVQHLTKTRVLQTMLGSGGTPTFRSKPLPLLTCEIFRALKCSCHCELMSYDSLDPL